jgi:hypothetical protein
LQDIPPSLFKSTGYPHELWTTRLLARRAREHGPAEGHPCLPRLAQGTLCKILNGQEIKPHKVRYYLERRDPEFKRKMAEVLWVYREVKLIKETAAAAKQEPSDAVALIFVIAREGRVCAGFGRQVRRHVGDRLNAGLLIIGDDRHGKRSAR